MTCSKKMRFALIALLTTLSLPVILTAQDHPAPSHQHHHYQLIDMGTLGGPNSYMSGPALQILNRRGALAGYGNTATPNPNLGCYVPFNAPDCFVENPFVWENGVVAALPVLPGGLNGQTVGISSSGLIVGGSENGLIDPTIGLPESHAVLWTKDHQIIDLGTVTGGTESLAIANNSRGQAVGFSNNDVPDSFSFLGLPTQTRAFLWQNGAMQDLGTLGGPDALAQDLNERGQVAGWSYTNSIPNSTTGIPTQDPFLWQNGTMRDIGTLGGTVGFAYAVNNRGQVAGISNLDGDNVFHPFFWDKKQGLKDLGTLGGDSGMAYSINEAGDIVGGADLPGTKDHHAFLWRHGVMTDLGEPAGDECSDAFAINSKGQIVGDSVNPCANGGISGHTWLWENGGPPVDLDTLIFNGSGLFMLDAFYINDRGEIAGDAVPAGDPYQHAVLLIPCDENHPGVDGCDYSLVDAAAAQSPARSEERRVGKEC